MEVSFQVANPLYEIDKLDMSNPAVVEISLYAAILTLLVSHELLDLVIEYPMKTRCLAGTLAATFRSHAHRGSSDSAITAATLPPPLLERMATDIQKVH